jgi:hypothetical protein
LATIRIVKTTVWTRWARSRLVLSSGRMSSIAAPVVPMKDAMTPPMARKIVLLRGVARRSPAEEDAAGDDEERQQQHDELRVLDQARG